MARHERGRGFPALAGVCLLALAAGTAMAQEGQADEPAQAEGAASPDLWELPEPDTSRWSCDECPFPSGWRGHADVGAGYVSDDSFGFGDYRGLGDKGAFAILGGELRYRGEDGAYADLRGDELGLDARSLRAEGGRQGRYELRLEYDQLPHLVADDTRTVYDGVGSANLTLPSGWVDGGNTGAMTQLDASLRDADIETERKSLGLGFDLLGGDRWRTSVDYHRDTKEGTRVQGGSFLFNSALLPAPVDYETERVDASVGYVRDRWQLEAAYHVSTFTNEHDALVWENPFTSGSNADEGRLALAPDNEFNQLMLSGAWRSRGSLTVAGRLAVGRMEQNEDFLAPTTNTSTAALAAVTNPRDDLGGEVDTRTANLRVTGEPLARLTAKAELYHDERDNGTPRDDYTQVATDTLVGDTRTNRPYSYEKSGAEATLDYRLAPEMTLSGTAGREDFERTFQEVEETQTDTLGLGLRATPTDRLQLRVRRTRELRDGAYEQLGLAPPENPDMRKFHIAERTRDVTRTALDYMASARTTIGFSIELAEDEYTDSDIGLTEARDQSVSLDVSTALTENTTAYTFLSLQSVSSRIEGADNITGAPWSYDQDDRYRTFGAGLELADLPGRFTRGGLDWTYAQGITDIDVDKAVSAPPLPDIDTRLYTLNLYANRPLGESAELRIGYLLEGFREDDFQRDGVDPDTIPSVLTLGQGSGGYTVHVIRAALRYRF